MIKKAIPLLISSALCLSPLSATETDTNLSAYTDMGTTGGDALSNGVSLSMLGWGLIIITGITILCIVLHQSTSSSHS